MTNNAAPHMNLTDWVLLVALSIVWGGSFLFIGIAVKELPPFTIVLLRVALAAATLHIVLRILRMPMQWDARSWRAFFGMGLLNNVIPFSLIVWGQTHIASGLASILNATTPIFIVIVAHILTTDERMTKGRIAGVLLGLAGVIVLIGPQALGADWETTWSRSSPSWGPHCHMPLPESSGVVSSAWTYRRSPPRPARSAPRP